jgi:hypothetical protein
MLVKIEKCQTSAMEFAATLCDLKAEFFTVESTVKDTPDIVQVYLLDENGNEPTALRTWYLARHFEIKLKRDELVATEVRINDIVK